MPKPFDTFYSGPVLVKANHTNATNIHIIEVTNVTSRLLAFKVVGHNFDRWTKGNTYTGLLARRNDQYSAIFETDATVLPPLRFTVRAMFWWNSDVPVWPEAFDVVKGDCLQIITFKDTTADVQEQTEAYERSTDKRSRDTGAPLSSHSKATLISQTETENEPESEDNHVKFEEPVSVVMPHEGESGPVGKCQVPRALPHPMPNPPPTHPFFLQINDILDARVECRLALNIMAATKKYDSKVGYPVCLRNAGNTCYMNAVIQCLYFTYDLPMYFCVEPYPFSNDLCFESGRKWQGIVASTFASLLFLLNERNCSSIKPKRFRDAVVLATGHFEELVEHDAQELLSTVIDALHEDLNKGDKTYRIPEQNNINLRGSAEVTAAADHAWNAYKKHSWSAIYDIFTGQTISTMQCSHCGLESNTFDIFTQITVDIAQSGAQLSDCLASHFVRERLCEAVWGCPNCQVKRKATKEIKLWRLPKYLIMQLKRFKPGAGGVMEKNTAEVRYPFLLSDDSMRAHMHEHSNRYQRQLYHLYAIVQHVGNMHTGHYTASTREGMHWYQFDDQRLYDDTDDHLKHKQAAYLLFYVRTN